MQKLRQIIFLLGIIVITFFCCKKEKDDTIQTEGYIIGFDPCEGDVKTSNRGFVIACNNLKDTFVTYNLPDTIFDFPQYLFCNYIYSCMFPNSEYLNYKIKFQYRLASKNEKQYHACLAIIYIWEFSQFVEKQIVLNDVIENP
jgi:hypothetical protein